MINLILKLSQNLNFVFWEKCKQISRHTELCGGPHTCTTPAWTSNLCAVCSSIPLSTRLTGKQTTHFIWTILRVYVKEIKTLTHIHACWIKFQVKSTRFEWPTRPVSLFYLRVALAPPLPLAHLIWPPTSQDLAFLTAFLSCTLTGWQTKTT